MLTNCGPEKTVLLEDWRWKFAWRSARIGQSTCVWLGWYERRMVVIDEGNWAGGFKYKWENRKWVGGPSLVTEVTGSTPGRMMQHLEIKLRGDF